jgi:hypothetical protein
MNANQAWHHDLSIRLLRVRLAMDVTPAHKAIAAVKVIGTTIKRGEFPTKRGIASAFTPKKGPTIENRPR